MPAPAPNGEIPFSSAFSILHARHSPSALTAEECASSNTPANMSSGQTLDVAGAGPDLRQPGAFARAALQACPCADARRELEAAAEAAPDPARIDFEKYAHMRTFPAARLAEHALAYQASREAAHKRLATVFRACRIGGEGGAEGFRQAEYVAAVSEATATFAVLSTFVRVCLHFLERLGGREAAVEGGVRALQEAERRKLELTCALHLAHVRLVAEAGEGGGGRRGSCWRGRSRT